MLSTHSPCRMVITTTTSSRLEGRLNSPILVFWLTTFCFSLATAIFMATNYRNSGSLNWYDFDAFRYLSVANVIITAYLWPEMWVSLWEISRNSTLLPETHQLSFNFGQDLVFAYWLMSMESARVVPVRTMKSSDECVAAGVRAFCIQSEITTSLGFADFLFLGLSSLLLGFRVACFLVAFFSEH